MKKLAAALALMLVLCSCTANVEEADGQKLYFISTLGQTVARKGFSYEYLDSSAFSGEERYTFILEALRKPSKPNNAPAIPPSVSVHIAATDGRSVMLEFSNEYMNLSPVDRILAAASCAMSVIDTGEVDYVFILCENGELPFGDKYFTADSILFNDFVLAPDNVPS